MSTNKRLPAGPVIIAALGESSSPSGGLSGCGHTQFVLIGPNIREILQECGTNVVIADAIKVGGQCRICGKSSGLSLFIQCRDEGDQVKHMPPEFPKGTELLMFFFWKQSEFKVLSGDEYPGFTEQELDASASGVVCHGDRDEALTGIAMTPMGPNGIYFSVYRISPQKHQSGNTCANVAGRPVFSEVPRWITPDPEARLAAAAHYNVGVSHAREGRLDKAVEEYSAAILLQPALTSAYFNRANALDRLGRHQQALTDYEQTVGKDPLHMRGWCNAGLLLLKMGLLDKALHCLDTAASLGDEKAEEQAKVTRRQLQGG